MGKIHVLDQNTINQIAAGEVIDRPSSVIKELCENAIDAGSTAVTVEIKDGGLSMMRITDNGSGIAKDDIKNAFIRHATSKISSAIDLLSIRSLGFRGEALASIAAVCKVELITKRREDLFGNRYVIEGGEEISLEEIGVPDGTTFVVRNIFYNTPARLKFLKAAQTEGIYIGEIVEKMALSHPEVSFRFISNGQSKLFTSGNGRLKDVIYAIYGRELVSSLIPVHSKKGALSISGFLAKPLVAKGNRSFETYFINGRYIKSKILAKAIEDAYKPFMMQHKYPFTVLMFDVPGELFDVNVHPSKMEIRFRQEMSLYEEVMKTISECLSSKEMIVPATIGKEKKEEKPKSLSRVPEPFEVQRMRKEIREKEEETIQAEAKPEVQETKPVMTEAKPVVQETKPVMTEVKPAMPETKPVMPETKPVMPDSKPAMSEMIKTEPGLQVNTVMPEKYNSDEVQAVNTAGISEKTESDGKVHENTEYQYKEQLTLFDDRLLSKQARSKHRLIGQVFDTYWMVEYEDKLYIIDQHAAHEKVLFERTMKSLKNKEFTSQMISPPVIIHLTEREAAVLNENMKYFTELGFEIGDFGGSSYSVTAIPANLYSLNQKELLMEIIDDLCESGLHHTSQMVLDKIASMSCKAAVKGNMRISEAEANALIEELLTLDNPYACPHGRPTIISISKYEMEKKFKRVL